jgi:hypothetical protein
VQHKPIPAHDAGMTTITTMTQEQADAYVRDWMDAWNTHDLDRIAAHYRDDVEYHSPFLARLTPDGRISGREDLRNYFANALERYPDLNFGSAIAVGVGAGSICMRYYSVENLVAMETLVFDENGLVARAYSHYHERRD